MRLLVFGATGGTGRQVVRLALEQGHQVTAFARRPAAVTRPRDGHAGYGHLAVIAGDVLDPAAVDGAVAGHDVVISTLGTREGDDWILPQATAYICESMRQHDVRRLICVTALGVGESRTQLGPTFAVLAVDLRETLAEKEAQEQVIRESGLDWIIVRPGALIDGARTGVYRCITDPAAALPRAVIARADVADFILKHLDGDEHLRQAVSLAY